MSLADPPQTPRAAMTSIIDNQGENTLQHAIERITENGRELWIATAFFSLNALNLVGENLLKAERIRLLYGGEASPRHRNAILQEMQRASDKDLLEQRKEDPLLGGLHHARRLIREGRLEARIYTKQNFHAKLYISHRTGEPPVSSIVGSGNFTISGLTQNVELNLKTQEEQTEKLVDWYEQKWAEAEADDFTEILAQQLDRHIKLYDPYTIYLRALLAWGDWVQGRETLPTSAILPKLDPHQEDGYRQALNIIKREGGVMICDGVGLGKSYIALALIEHFLQRGESVLLLAPRAIIDASWEFYVADHLRRYTMGFDNLKKRAITYFGYRPEPTEEDLQRAQKKGETIKPPSPDELKRYEELDVWSEQSNVVVIDESHNLRRTDANRYVNILRMLQPKLLGNKKVILLTATPLNTDYTDVTAQFKLICLDGGAIGGIPHRELQAEAVQADGEMRKDPERTPSLFGPEVGVMNQALHTIAIQRSRATCKLLAEKRDQRLRFPEREGLAQIEYKLSPLYATLVEKTERDFKELANFIKSYRDEVKRAAGSESKKLRKGTLKLPKEGMRFSAYLPDRYRYEEPESLREAQVESFLVMLVFTNVMKQLESSIAAFEGILRSLGAGLCARLHHVFGEDVAHVLNEHLPWIKDSLKHLDADDEAFEYDPAGLSAQDEDYLESLQSKLKVHKTLADFSHETHNTKLWREHIESDLRKLAAIYERAILARDEGDDCKLDDVAAQIASQRAAGRKVLVFTQSVRTAEYLHRELPNYLPDQRIDRITAAIQGQKRQELLHAFSPKYNPMINPPMEFQELGVLISTDVLSEGVNLQEAGCILNYDLHWNPVRLIQRIGRVDRRLRDDDPGHSFSILNVLPPPEIELILNLVGTVEGRKRKILKLLGLDQSFFSATDEEGTLKEFNKMVEGETGPRDMALSHYVDTVVNLPKEINRAKAAPDGAFGVWANAPVDGYFGLFRVALRENASDADRERFGPIEGQPILVWQGETVTLDAPEILEKLSATVRGESSGKPRDPASLKAKLTDLRRIAFSSIPNRTQATTAELVCWMEMRKGG